ncbi:MAG: CRISPR-associated helicase Cas3', partial [Caldilineaceae bacterium SB0668_bin_21]|nr:CRISPR-associated helicase Cas3' [Caldilineaceae bacterium SB0668_bin_21]
GHEPYPFQAKVAETHGLPSLLRIPTGSGKTETAILGWLYRYFHHPEPAVRATTPRRLVYCLPMRTLVEQTAARVEGWRKRLDKADDVCAVILMGGEPREQWYLHPEKPCIIIGTQDMLLSRALNRGYGSNLFMWPIEYGLLNNDCLWVMDEVQLMANGLPTSTQLAGLRHKLTTFGSTHSMWMSATVKPSWLDTIDHRAPPASQVLDLEPGDLRNPELAKRHSARKMVSELSIENGRNYARRLAEFIVDKHERGTLTLAIVNTVERSQEIYKALNNPRWVSLEAETVLIHSRFRAQEREEQRERLSQEMDAKGSGRIVVATQAIEAGVDISARTLITELAPWPSLVQRFGRCNRKGEYKKGDLFWIDTGTRPQDTTPYDPAEVEPARQLMKSLKGKSAGPSDIEELGDVMEDADHLTVIRKRDVVGLFDTTPDLSGSYLDVSQYVRGTDERDISVFWRHIPEEGPGEDEPKPVHSELVSVPRFGKSFLDYLKEEGRRVWRWDFLDGRWIRVFLREIHPGMTLMLDAAQGGYSVQTGWDPSNEEAVAIVVMDKKEQEEGQSSDPLSTQKRWTTLPDHTRRVVSEVEKILKDLSGLFVDQDTLEAVRVAARYHDAGKAHPAFQEMLRKGATAPPSKDVMAKSPGNGRMDPSRRHFRHELGSAIAILEHVNGVGETVRDLAAYLAASHHGKVRIGIRSLPGQRRGFSDSNPDTDYLLGYRLSTLETLPAVELDEGLRIDKTTLDLSLSQIGLAEDGQPSWLERSLDLLEWLGPFRLAYLEAVLRAADMRASKEEQEN